MAPRPRRSFTPEFKAHAVELVRCSGKSVGQVVIEPGGGTAVGALIGGITGQNVYDAISMAVNAPHFEADAAAIDAREDQRIRAASH